MVVVCALPWAPIRTRVAVHLPGLTVRAWSVSRARP